MWIYPSIDDHILVLMTGFGKFNCPVEEVAGIGHNIVLEW